MKPPFPPFSLPVLFFSTLAATFYLFHFHPEETFLVRTALHSQQFLIETFSNGTFLLEDGSRGMVVEMSGKQGPLCLSLLRSPTGSGTFTLLENHDFHLPFSLFPKFQKVEREKKGRARGLIKIDGFSGATLTGKLIEGNLTRTWSRLEREADEKK